MTKKKVPDEPIGTAGGVSTTVVYDSPISMPVLTPGTVVFAPVKPSAENASLIARLEALEAKVGRILGAIGLEV